jgi:putative acetyltransferase
MTTPAPAFRIAPEDPATTEIAALIRDAEAHSARLYPAESNHHLPLEALRRDGVRFLVARDAADRAVGIGAVALHGTWAEIKSMWVVEAVRGLGVAGLILERLLALAAEAGAGVVRLETGVASHSALALYGRFGFVRCPPFADYRDDPLSVFMERRTAVGSSA